MPLAVEARDWGGVLVPPSKNAGAWAQREGHEIINF